MGLKYSGAAIDLSALRIVDGKTCWVLCIDGLVLSSDGNLLDALSIAIKVLIVFLF
jgi:exosome complex RNA-binding protein Rrp42 (RNase PH superfamily)